MKVHYRSAIKELDELLELAVAENRKIELVELTPKEWDEFVNHPDFVLTPEKGKQCVGHYANVRLERRGKPRMDNL